MKNYSKDYLYGAMDQYVQSKDALINEAENQVVEKRYSVSQMPALNPVFLDPSLRHDLGSTSHEWLSDNPPADAFEHGFDSQNRIRWIRGLYGISLFVYREGEVDEIRFTKRSENTSFVRRILEQGKITECWSCWTSPMQYQVELFKYREGRVCSSEVHSWFESSEGWTKASWIAKNVFEHDAVGLLRTYHDDGLSSTDRLKLVFVRPGMGLIRQQQRERRLFVGYSIALTAEEKDKSHRVYSDAYGIEMSISMPSQCPVDVVICAPPSLVRVITKGTDVTAMENISAGASSVSGVCDILRTRMAGGKWAVVDAGSRSAERHIISLLRTKLGIIACVRDIEEARQAIRLFNVTSSHRLVIALKFAQHHSPESSHTTITKIREHLDASGFKRSRIVLASPPTPSEAAKLVAEQEVDGVFLLDASFSDLLDAFVPVALESC